MFMPLFSVNLLVFKSVHLANSHSLKFQYFNKSYSLNGKKCINASITCTNMRAEMSFFQIVRPSAHVISTEWFIIEFNGVFFIKGAG